MQDQRGHSDPDRSSGKEQKRSVTGRVHVQGEIEVHLPPGVQKQNSTANQKRETRETIKQWVQSITLFFVIVVAGFNGVQSYESIKSATASQKSAEIANYALHVSERAYLNLGPMTTASFDEANKTLNFSIVNTGHLPAEDVQLTFYRIAINTDTPWSRDYKETDVVDFGKTESTFPNIAPIQAGSPNQVASYFDHMDATRADAGREKIAVAGYATYKAGFDDEPRQKWSFCLQTEHELVLNKNAISYCNINEYLPILTKLAERPEWKGK